MKTINRLLDEITWFDIFTTLIIALVIYSLFFADWNNQTPYNSCVMKAIDKLESSSDILSLCKELK